LEEKPHDGGLGVHVNEGTAHNLNKRHADAAGRPKPGCKNRNSKIEIRKMD
jgi:hypothetical protein